MSVLVAQWCAPCSTQDLVWDTPSCTFYIPVSFLRFRSDPIGGSNRLVVNSPLKENMYLLYYLCTSYITASPLCVRYQSTYTIRAFLVSIIREHVRVQSKIGLSDKFSFEKKKKRKLIKWINLSSFMIASTGLEPQLSFYIPFFFSFFFF